MEDRLRGTIRLRLLALVLALAVTWYAMNPAPGLVRGFKRGDGQLDEKRREAQSPGLSCPPVEMETDALKSAPDSLSSAAGDVDDLEWPEVIHIG